MRIEADTVDVEGRFVMLFCMLCNDRGMLGRERECDDDECVQGKGARTGEEGVKGLLESVTLLT